MTSTPAPPVHSRITCDEVGGAVVDGPGAEPLAGGALVVGAGSGEDRGAECARQLDGGRADAARAAVDEHRLAFREPAAIEEVGPDREERLGNRRRLSRPEPVVAAAAPAVPVRRSTRVTPARDERAHVVALAPSRDVRANGRDRAGDFEAGEVRHARGRWILTEPLQDVRTIDARSFDAYQHLAVSGGRYRPIDQSQDVRAAGLRDLNRFHRGVSCPLPPLPKSEDASRSR